MKLADHEVAKAAFNFSIASIFMILINKHVATVFQYPAFLLFTQNILTVVLLKIWKTNLSIDLKIAFRWLPCVFLFSSNIYFSMLALKFVSVPTFTVFRNIQPIISTVLDFILCQKATSTNNIICLFVILLGAYIYAYDNMTYHVTGYMWMCAFVICSSSYTIAVKFFIDSYRLQSHEMSFYNNTLSLVPLSLLIFYEEPSHLIIDSCLESMPCWLSVVVSSYGAFFISVAGFQAQEVMSPTTWLTCNNLSKIPAIILSCWLWEVNLREWQIIGLIISILGGFLYSLSSQDLLPHVLPRFLTDQLHSPNI